MSECFMGQPENVKASLSPWTFIKGVLNNYRLKQSLVGEEDAPAKEVCHFGSCDKLVKYFVKGGGERERSALFFPEAVAPRISYP